MQSVFSGLDEAGCRALVGQAAWDSHSCRWLRYPDLVQALMQGREDAQSRFFWLYRSPGSALVNAVGLGEPSVRDVLERWFAECHEVLDVWRRRRGDGLQLVKVEEIADGEMPSGFPARSESGIGEEAEVAGRDAALCDTLDSLVGYYLPRYMELLRELEASCWLAPGRKPNFENGINSEVVGWEALELQVAKVTSVLRLQRGDEELAGKVRELETGFAETGRENELLLLQVTRMQQLSRNDHATIEELTASNEGLVSSNRQLAERAAAIDAAHAKSLSEIASIKASQAKLQQELVTRKATQSEALQAADRLKRNVSVLQARLELQSARSREPEAEGGRGWLAGVKGPLARRTQRRRASAERARQIDVIRRSAWFDSRWYVENNPDVRDAGIDPVAHYYDFGWMEGRNPSAGFDTDYYVSTHSDVVRSGFNPLWHFLSRGESDGLATRES